MENTSQNAAAKGGLFEREMNAPERKRGFINSLKFTFITEDGTTRLTIPQYHTRQDLMDKVGLITTPAKGRRTVFMGTTIFSLPESLIAADPKLEKMIMEAEREVARNPLMYFVPQNDVALSFLNCHTCGIKIFRGGNGSGKSVIAWIDILLDIFPCDPSWPIFSVHGVKFRPFYKPFSNGGVGIVTYEWINHKHTIYPQVVLRWTPKHKENVLRPNWKDNPSIVVAGTPVYFMACSQADTVFESQALDRVWWDEQGQESKFNGANARIRRRNGRHVFSLTPHKVDGRPDTGAGSWIQKIESGEMDVGHSVRVFQTSIFSIPDWIYSEKAKRDAFREWIENPLETNNIKRYREGRSRIYGEYHQTSGMVFDVWNREIHVIQKMDLYNVTRYRSIDHGRVNPTACVFAAVDQDGNLIIYDEYYQRDRTAIENAVAIIEKSGNYRKLVGRFFESGVYLDRYEEVQVIPFRLTIMDSRSFSSKDVSTHMTIERLYNMAGLRLRKASGQPMDVAIPIASEWLRPDPERQFPAWHRKAGEYGAPRCFVMEHCKNFIYEMENYMNEPVRLKRDGLEVWGERPRAKDDHLMTAFIYLTQENLIWIPDPMYSGDNNGSQEPDDAEMDVMSGMTSSRARHALIVDEVTQY